MSVNVSTEVWAHSSAAGTALLVQLALADHADDQTRSCWPSLSSLAKKTRTSRDTVRRALRELEGLGEVEVPVRGGVTGRRITQFGGINLLPVAS